MSKTNFPKLNISNANLERLQLEFPSLTRNELEKGYEIDRDIDRMEKDGILVSLAYSMEFAAFLRYRDLLRSRHAGRRRGRFHDLPLTADYFDDISIQQLEKEDLEQRHMKDFVVYHNPDFMGYPASKHGSLSVLTNKKVSDVVGDRVWLLTGEGRPRRYFLCAWFFIDQVDSGEDDGFVTCLSGETGKSFDPILPIDQDADWFKDFRAAQGNFAFGFSLIKDLATIKQLEDLANTGIN